ncbi:MAG: potassium transporter TrkH [Lachnospiraceae bacterium]|nr:potassium transporter TrkH [Lachnospiraceae bacterium]
MGFSSTQVLFLGFLAVILLGALLLMLPAATAPGEETSFLTALFTSTTSICVTGLVVVDTFSHWSLFGKAVILVLIQLGGFGVVTFYSIFVLALRKRFSLKLTTLVRDYYNLDSMQGLLLFLKKVIKGTLAVEGIGAILYAFTFIPRFGPIKGLGVSIFNSVSAFCNAGMDIIGPDSLIGYQDNLAVNWITMSLIVVGGLGYVVWFDCFRNAEKVRKQKLKPIRLFTGLSEHTKLVLGITLFLILSGALLIFIFERKNPETLGGMDSGGKLLASLFQSITFRTAGFATIPQQSLSEESCVLGLVYMFIGGSPVGTAGGVKTVTVFIIFANMLAYMANRREAVVFGRGISQQMVNKASAIVTASLGAALLLTILLAHFSRVPMLDAAYEIFSATATVGLSRGLTPTLNSAGKIIVIIGMYLGRLGPISMGLLFAENQPSKNGVHFADGHFFIG